MQHEQKDDPIARFDSAARYSTVTTRLRDGRRRVRVTDHKTGEVEVTMLPPRRGARRRFQSAEPNM
jgi:hypothetical protein